MGLIGIGGRSGAAQAMAPDENVALTAIGDLFEEESDKTSQSNPQGQRKRQISRLPPETTFLVDAYKKVIDSGWMCDFNFPANFRPQHLEYAVEKGVHCFSKACSRRCPGSSKGDVGQKGKGKES